MPNLPKGTVVAKGECHNCGKSVQIKLNKNGGAYYFCPWPDAEGQPCNHSERWGRAASQNFQRAYLDHRKKTKETTDEQPARREPADIQQQPEPKPAGGTSGDIFADYG